MENRRKNYFIKKEFQTKFIMKFCVLVTLTAIISAFLVYLFLSHSVTTVFENSRIMIKPSTEFIMPGLILSSLISIVLVSVATIIVVLFISHRIAGPLYKLEDSLERMGEGDISFDISFRKGDEARVLSEVFNKSRRRLNGMISAIKKDFKEGRDIGEKLEKFRL
ncbi:MAG: methyl-accepting chemotaxis protein [Candidatus Omnitrophica bacterium]|nr:methyl-accepting chemotaxis protein [Candidatus Omnitrophota bacterium]